MTQIQERKSIGTLLMGYSLIGIAGYIFVRFAGFILDQIELPVNFTNLGLAASIIIVTLGATAFLLRFDLKNFHKHGRYYHDKVIFHK